MGKTKLTPEIAEAHFEVGKSLAAFHDAPVHSYEAFSANLHEESGMFSALANLIALTGDTRKDTRHTRSEAFVTSVKGRVGRNAGHAILRTWGEDSKALPEIQLGAHKKFALAKPVYWLAELTDKREGTYGHIFDKAQVGVGNHGKISRPDRFAYLDSDEFEHGHGPIFAQNEAPIPKDATPISPVYSEIAHYRDTLVDLSVLLLMITGVKKEVAETLPAPANPQGLRLVP